MVLRLLGEKDIFRELLPLNNFNAIRKFISN